MNIIEAVRALVADFPKVGEVHIDFTDNNDGSCALLPTGDTLIREDVIGNQTRRHNFILLTHWQSQSDYDRASNSGVLLELHGWFESSGRGIAITHELDGVIHPGELTKLTCSNGMFYTIPSELNRGGQYQLQITAEYKVNMED